MANSPLKPLLNHKQLDRALRDLMPAMEWLVNADLLIAEGVQEAVVLESLAHAVGELRRMPPSSPAVEAYIRWLEENTRMGTLPWPKTLDPSKVNWGGPKQQRTEVCSYCGDKLDEDSVPLILWNTEGWCAEFCDHCQTTHWGMQTFDEPADPVDEPEVAAANRRAKHGRG